MKDPLTAKEKRKYLRTFGEQFHETYKKALDCGALSERGPHDHTIARYCLIRAAEDFSPLSRKHRKELANLRHFV